MDDQLKKLTDAFNEIGVDFTIREDGEFSYVFVGELRDIHDLDGSFETSELATLLIRHKFYEFESGELVSYSSC